MMELLALFAVILIAAIGWITCRTFFRDVIPGEYRCYFAPAVGAGVCAIVAYLGVHLGQQWIIPLFILIAFIGVIRCFFFLGQEFHLKPNARRLLFFTLLVLLSLYGMQICLFHLFAKVQPGPDEVWSLFNLSSVPPPDQMFAWHQAAFAELHRHYPQDPFYNDIDLYDRPHLGGYLTLFFFKLFGLPLTDDQHAYSPVALRFYHCLWWLLNDLYLLGVAPLFKRMLGQRAAILAVVSTALGGFFFLCTVGGWMKFASAYPFLLALLLFVLGEGPILQAGLCALSYYIHGSVLLFLAGFGLLQIFSIYYPIKSTLTPAKHVVRFALVSCILIGAWFVTVRLMESKQPLFYYYIYDAGLTEAQTRPVAEIAKDFYTKNSWSALSLMPLQNLLRNLFPVPFINYLTGKLPAHESIGFTGFANVICSSQRTCLMAALGLFLTPVLFAGLGKTLAQRHAGKIVLSLYLVPTLLMLLLYRKQWALLLQITYPYHAFALFLWVYLLKNSRTWLIGIGLSVIAFESVISTLFAQTRFLPVRGLELVALHGRDFLYLAIYLALIAFLFLAGILELRQSAIGQPPSALQTSPVSGSVYFAVARKLFVAILLTAATFAAYSIYCLRFYET